MYETTDPLWRGLVAPRDITPLEVVYYSSKLWLLSNRRLAAHKMYYALCGDHVVWVRCVLRNEQHQRFDHAKTTLNDGLPIAPVLLAHAAPTLPSILVPLYGSTHGVLH